MRERSIRKDAVQSLRLVLLGEHLGVHALGLHAGLGGVGDVALVVLEALEGTTAGLLGLLLLGDLGGLVLDLTSASEGAVDLTHVGTLKLLFELKSKCEKARGGEYLE